MKAFDSLAAFSYNKYRYGLVAMAAALVTIHFTLTWRLDDTNLLFSSVIFWSAAASLLWQKRQSIKLHPSATYIFIGIIELAAVLFLTFTLPSEVNFQYVYPFLVGIGLAFMASGLEGLRQYWRELLLLFMLGVPEVALTEVFDPGVITARVSHLMLWYSGFDVTREGAFLYLPGGSVEVTQSCSGLRAMSRLLGMAVLTLLWLPHRWTLRHIVGLPILGITIAFFATCIRVAILAYLVSHGRKEAFDSLHGGQTSQLFSIFSIILFMSIVSWIVHRSTDSETEGSKLQQG